MNILLIGDEAAGIQALKSITSTGHRIVAVMASPPDQSSGSTGLWHFAAKQGYRTFPANLVKNPSFGRTVKDEEIDLLLNVHSLCVIHREVLSAPRIGSFNLHPGPLPRYAGLNTVSWAIYRGEYDYGVTLHEMVPAIDAGRIAYEASFKIEESDTALAVYSKCVKSGIPLLVQLLEAASRGPDQIPLRTQELNQREYFGRTVPEDGWIDWSRPARQIINFVRACDYLPFPSPWGHPRTRKARQEIAVVKAARTGRASDAPPGTAGATESAGINVACGDEWITLHRLFLGGTIVSAASALAAGDRLENRRPAGS